MKEAQKVVEACIVDMAKSLQRQLASRDVLMQDGPAAAAILSLAQAAKELAIADNVDCVPNEVVGFGCLNERR